MIADNSGKQIGYLATFISDKEVTKINATDYFTTSVIRNRQAGRVEMQTFYGKNPLVSR